MELLVLVIQEGGDWDIDMHIDSSLVVIVHMCHT